jgi:hypothetical protein
MLNAELSGEDKTCLDDFHHIRSKLFRDFGWSSSAREEDLPQYRSVQVEEIGTHELLISEVIVTHLKKI